MRSIVFDYLNNYSSFQLFGKSHWIAIILFFLIAVILPWFSKKYLEEKYQSTVGLILIFLVFINYPVWVFLELIAGTFDLKLHLPLHLCRLRKFIIAHSLDMEK